MQQPFLDITDLHRTHDRGHAHRMAAGAAIAAACGLQSCGTTTWDNTRRDWERISLTVYRPMYGRTDRYAVTRFFDGQYAHVVCLIPEHAMRAISATNREEFEHIAAASTARHAGDASGTDEVSTAIDAAHDAALATLLWTEVGEARTQARGQRLESRLEARQLTLF